MKSGVWDTVGFLMLYRGSLNYDSLIRRDICSGGLGAVKKNNHNIDRLTKTKPKV
jgi:hypothetical protein